MNRRDLCKKTVAAMIGAAMFDMPELAWGADVFETRLFKAVPILWDVVDPKTGKPCRMMLETIRELDGTYSMYTRRLGDLGKFHKTPVNDRIHPVWDKANLKFGGPEFYPRFDKALL